MTDTRSRITVVGKGNTVDVAVVSRAPIAQYIVDLAAMCEESATDSASAVWSLCEAGGQPLAPDSSLHDGGLGDGSVLYLTDLAGGDADSFNQRLDVDEVVISESTRIARRAVPIGLLLAGAALVWLGAVSGVLMVRSWNVFAASCLSIAGLLLVGSVWVLEQRLSLWPRAASVVLALGASPCFAAAGGIFAAVVVDPGLRWPGVVIGANIGLLLAVAVVPDPVVVSLELQAAACALVTPALLIVRAGPAQTAIVVSLVALAAVASAKSVAGFLSAYWPDPGAGVSDQEDQTPVLLGRSMRILAVWLAVPCIALSICLPSLGSDGEPWDIALAVAISVALAVKAYQAIVVAEAVMVGGAATAGLFGLLLPRLGDDRWSGPAIVLIGLAVTLLGILLALAGTRRRQDTGELARKTHRSLDVAGSLAAAISVPLALGAMGVLSLLLARGREML